MKYNLDFDICGLIILLLIIIILNSQYKNSTSSQKYFKRFVYASFVSTALDIIGSLTSSYYELFPQSLNIALNNLYAAATATLGCYAIRYITEVTRLKNSKIKMFSYWFTAVYFVLLFINSFTGVIFTFSNGPYEPGPLYACMFVIPAFYIITSCILTIIYRKRFPNKRYVLNLFFGIVPVIPTILQVFFFPTTMLTHFGINLGIFIMLFAVESPDYHRLVSVQNNLEKLVLTKTSDLLDKNERLENFSIEVVEAFVKTIDAKDDYTQMHSSRVAEYSVAIAKELGMDEESIKRLRYSALLHDVGKVGVPDYILKKPGKLTDEEFNIIKEHTFAGEKILKQITVFDDAAYVARHHHERYDGHGYPDGLKGEDIRIMARIVCVADCYDAMTSKRIYKEIMNVENAKKELIRCSGTQFDPKLVEIFTRLIDNGTFD